MFDNMISHEISAEIFKGKEPWEHVGLTDQQAQAIVDHPNVDCLDRNLVDWAWNTLIAE